MLSYLIFIVGIALWLLAFLIMPIIAVTILAALCGIAAFTYFESLQINLHNIEDQRHQ